MTHEKPHRYRRAKVTRANLDGDSRRLGWEWDLPCAECGASELVAAHVLYSPKRRPNLDGALAAIAAHNAAAAA